MKAGILCAATLAALACPALAQAQDLTPDQVCSAVWTLMTGNPEAIPLTGTYHGVEDGWCRFTDIAYVTQGISPDIEIDELRLNGLPIYPLLLSESLQVSQFQQEVRVSGFRMVTQAGQPKLDWLLRAQGRAHGISGELTFDWDIATKVLTLSNLQIDFPGDNAVSMTAKMAGIDLTSLATIEASATSFAFTEISMDFVTHGIFETYLLLALGETFLPGDGNADGDMDAAAEALRADALGVVAMLPDAAFPAETKAALSALIDEMPNPSGRLELDFTASPGFGAVQLEEMAMSGEIGSVADAGPLLEGVRLDATWTATKGE